MPAARDWIRTLELEPHPEGGHFRETYRSREKIVREALPTRFQGDRAFSTAIYFLLEGTEISAMHRIHQDEVWHFYDGASLIVEIIDPDGNYSALRLGRDIASGEHLQGVVTAGCWFGSRLADPTASPGFALVGCTVAPGFDFADFEMPGRAELLAKFPSHKPVIERLTR
jgi:predicted cupin superfamily sugar epimerase